jgi:hypothetical protein
VRIGWIVYGHGEVKDQMRIDYRSGKLEVVVDLVTLEIRLSIL